MARALGFGCRCGRCDVGYYGLSGQCYKCGSTSLVFFLSRAVPALGIVGMTAFFYGGGIVSFPTHRYSCVRRASSLPHSPMLTPLLCSCVGQPTVDHGPFPGYGTLAGYVALVCFCLEGKGPVYCRLSHVDFCRLRVETDSLGQCHLFLVIVRNLWWPPSYTLWNAAAGLGDFGQLVRHRVPLTSSICHKCSKPCQPQPGTQYYTISMLDSR